MDALVHPWFRPETLVGATLQGYSLESLVGVGGFGAVYRTKSTQGEARAIKVLFPPRSTAPEDACNWDNRVTVFMREANAASHFQHPNIIRVFDAGQTRWRFNLPGVAGEIQTQVFPLLFYVAEFIPDGVDRRSSGGRLFSSEEATGIGVQVCDALTALHRANPPILHRDLNPGNIRLAEDGRAVLTDFGVARIADVPGAYVTSEGPPVHRGVGAPDQFRWEEPDERTDTFQVGALLLKMLTGKYPREGAPRALLEQKGVRAGLAQAVLRCLEEDRAKRFPDAPALKAALLGKETAAPKKDVPLTRVTLSPAWQLQLPSATWRAGATPLVEGEACFAWDDRTVYRLTPERGAHMNAWTASYPMRDSFRSPAVQLNGHRLYVRHGSLLSCLDGHGSEQWRAQLAGDLSGAFLPLGDKIIVDSLLEQGGAIAGIAALDAGTGAPAWTAAESEFQVEHLACEGDAVWVVESMGIAGASGVRVRKLDLASGREVGRLQLVGSEAATPLGAVPLVRPWPALPGPEQSLVVGLRDLLLPRIYLMCVGSDLKLRWTRLLDAALPGRHGVVSLAAVQGRLLVCIAGHSKGGDTQVSWACCVDLANGERLWQRQCPEDMLLTDPAAAPDAPLAYAIAHRAKQTAMGEREWRLVALDPKSGDIEWQGPVRKSPRGRGPLSPVVTAERVYVQFPLERLKDAKTGGRTGKGMLEAHQRR